MTLSFCVYTDGLVIIAASYKGSYTLIRTVITTR